MPSKNGLTKSNIEYLNYTWSFYTGCKQYAILGANGKPVCAVGRERCWANTVITRFHDNYPNGFNPTFYPERLMDPIKQKIPARIGVAFMGDLGGSWVDPGSDCFMSILPGLKLRDAVFSVIEQCPQHQFLFLSKTPGNWRKWGKWPENAWVGGTSTGTNYDEVLHALANVNASHKWVSFEPLISWNIGKIDDLAGGLLVANIKWLVIGTMTPVRAYTQPRIEWVREIITAASIVNVAVYIKSRLQKVGWPVERKELPVK
jgi:protein gp37